MKKIIGLLVFTSVAVLNTVQAGGDVESGRTLSTSCSACHGNDGMSASELFPNIAGQKESYLVSQLKKYKSGQRADDTMAAIVGPLTEQNILDLAAYFSSNSAVASYSFAQETLAIPYVDVGGTIYNIEMSLDSLEGLVFSVSKLQER
ncbi:MAG TPA: cytochrome c [Methyloprofundus sp.]|nr:cytochrome c [Methyloprofundus sp.]HIL76611.1 cytochrome c [Rhodospirillales bacterium]